MLPLSPAVLQVEVEKTTYEAEFGGDVVLACRFQPTPPDSQQKLEVQWHWVKPGPAREVYRLEGQAEQTENQSPHYQGRVTLLREQLREGWIKLKVRERESGTKRVLWWDRGGRGTAEKVCSLFQRQRDHVDE